MRHVSEMKNIGVLLFSMIILLCSCGKSASDNEGDQNEKELLSNAEIRIGQIQEILNSYGEELNAEVKNRIENGQNSLKKAIELKQFDDLDSLISATDKILLESERPISMIKEKNMLMEEFKSGDPIPSLKSYIEESKSDIDKIMLWFQILAAFERDGDKTKFEQIRRGVYEAVYTSHLDEIEDDGKIFNLEKQMTFSNVLQSGDQKNIEVTNVTMTIEKPSMKLFGINVNLKAFGNTMSNNTGIEDKSYYGPFIKMRVKFKITGKHYYAENENDVKVEFIFGDAQNPARFDNIIFTPKLQGSNINSNLRYDVSDRIHELELDLPVWNYMQWNNRSNQWMEDYFDLLELVTKLSKSNLKEIRLNPYRNPLFDNQGRRI
jgi:hypothetical protein